MVISPAIFLTIFSILFNGLALLLGDFSRYEVAVIIRSLQQMIINIYFTLVAIGALTTFTQWNKIHTTNFKKVLYIFTFPLFMLTYIPITITALFKKVEWKPIEHSKAKTIAEIKEG